MLDGDGSLLMNLCGLTTAAWSAPKNLVHVVFDNCVYESSGSSPSATSGPTDLVAVAKAAGFPRAFWATDVDNFAQAVSEALSSDQLTFIGVKVQHGIVPGIASPTTDDTENKYRFMRHIEKLEGRKIFGSGYPEL